MLRTRLTARCGLLGTAAVLPLLGAVPAAAQMDSREAIALQNQILELRRDMQMMQQRGPTAPPSGYGRGGAGSGGSEIAAQLLDRVATLEEEVRRLRGQLDEQANQSRRQYDELAKQNADLQFRLGQAGSGGGGQGVPPPRPAGGPAIPMPEAPPAGRRTPELALQEGNAALARRDYAAAEAAAREVLSSGRSTPRSADAQYLLAQSLSGRRDYQGAAIAFDDAYKANRQGSRAPDSLLGLANALIGLNERPAACATLDRLRADHPQARPDLKEAAQAARGRAGCR